MNAVTIYFDFTYDELLTCRKSLKFYDREQMEVAVRDPYIIHFTISFVSHRPWCKYVGEWIKYRLMEE